MSFVKTPDGTDIFYKDWGKGQPIVFSHGWPLTSDAWDGQMLYFLQEGFRVIAHDRRGHGRSTQTWERNTMDQYADDLATVMNHLNLQNAIIIGHSTGGGEVTRYLGRHGTRRIAKAVLVSAVPPLMLQTRDNPKGTPLDAFDAIRGATRANRAQFFKDLPTQFYGWNRKGAVESPGIRDSFWLQSMMGGVKAIYDCIEQFSETDFTEDLKKIDVPTLIVHGDDDQIVPFPAAGQLSVKLIPKATLKVYPGADHGLAQTHQDRFNADVLSFIRE